MWNCTCTTTDIVLIWARSVILQEGFRYHHAEPGYVMLTYWIPDEPCMLPSTATHQIGVGAFVINKNREVILLLLLKNLSWDSDG